MNDLFDFIKNPKDREDFFIALIVIVLFGAAITYTIFPKADTSLSEQELVEQLSTSLAEGNLNTKIFTDIDSAEDFAATHKAEDATVISHTNIVAIPNHSDKVETIASRTNDDEALAKGELYDKNTAYKSKEEVTEYTTSSQKASSEDIKEQLAQLEAAELKDVKEDLAQLETQKENDPPVTKVTKDTGVTLQAKEKPSLKEEDNQITKHDKVESEIADSDKTKDTATDSKDETETTSPEIDEEPEATVIPTPYETTKPNPPKKKVEKSPCVIVVGAFKQAEGVTLMINQLKAAKYKVTTGYVRGLKYVGVPVDCNDHQKVMDEINETFNKEAWLLRR